jgi:hypothetical protein
MARKPPVPNATAKAKTAKVKPGSGAEPASENTQGLITPKTEPNAPGKPTNPPVKPETPQEKSLLEKAGELLEKGEIGVLNKAKDAVQGGIDSAVGAAGGGMIASAVGAIGKGAVEILFPTNVIDLIPGGKLLSGGKKAVKLGEKVLEKAGKEAAEKAAKEAEKIAQDALRKRAEKQAAKDAKAANGKGGGVSKSKKRKPNGRCHLIPYDELECPPKHEAHHVVPDFTGRTGTRKAVGGRVPGAPSLGEGLAICLPVPDHKEVHRLDKRFKGASDSTRGGSIAGTISGSQAKSISAANVEKATGGKKGGGCPKEAIKKQLDKKIADDLVLRGEKHAGKFGKMEDAINAVTRQGGKD